MAFFSLHGNVIPWSMLLMRRARDLISDKSRPLFTLEPPERETQ